MTSCPSLASGIRRPTSASFNRPNLLYRVEHRVRAPSTARGHRQAAGVRRPGSVYLRSRAGACTPWRQRLREDGRRAAAYHAGMARRVVSRRLQEAFLRDDIRAVRRDRRSGIGINKPNVRRRARPRPSRGTSRATTRRQACRSAMACPAECLLLFSAGDVAEQMRFVDEKPDGSEKERRGGVGSTTAGLLQGPELPPARSAPVLRRQLCRGAACRHWRGQPSPAAGDV
jgi:ATP-dependent DNA helicase RecQ